MQSSDDFMESSIDCMASRNFWLSAAISSNLARTDIVARPPYIFSVAPAEANVVNFRNKVALKRDTVWSIPVIGSSAAYTRTRTKSCSSISLHQLPRLILLHWNIWRETSSLLLRYVEWRELKAGPKCLISKVWCKAWCSAIMILTWSTAVSWKTANYQWLQCSLTCQILSHI